jgi:hypothetical protein
MNINSVKLKVKAMSLAEEARIIKSLEGECFNEYGHNEIRDHRIFDVRREARATNLARAFLSGKFYRTVENSRRPEKQHEFSRVQKRLTNIVSKYGNFKNGNAGETIQAWLNN